MIKLKILLKALAHIFVWLLIFTLNFIFIRSYEIEFDMNHQVKVFVIYVAIFYLNYYIVMPFLYRKKLVIYIVATISLLSGGLFIKDRVSDKYFKEVFERRVQENGFSDLRKERFPGILPKGRPFRGVRGRFLLQSYGVLLFYGLSFSTRFIKKWQEDEKHKSILEQERVKTELSFLKQQVNPHFLFNSLNSIYSLSLSKSDATTDTILKLSSILRYMLYESENSSVSLKDELKIIDDYIELQKLRLTEKVTVTFKVEGIPEEQKIESFILIPLIENAFKYGVDNINESFINLTIKITSTVLELTLDNKIVSGVEKDKDSGIGLKNISRRLELVYSGRHTFEYSSDLNCFKVYLKLILK